MEEKKVSQKKNDTGNLSYHQPQKKKKKGKIFSFIVLSICLSPLVYMFLSDYFGERQKEDLMRNGDPAIAEIVSFERSETVVNSIYCLEFVVRIFPKNGGASFIGQCEEFIDPIDYYKLQPEVKIPAYTDKEDPSEFVLIWEDAGIKTAF